MTQWTVKHAQLYSFWVFLLGQQIFENFHFTAMKEDCYHGLNLKFPNCSTKDIRGLWNLVHILRKILSTLSNITYFCIGKAYSNPGTQPT